MPAEVEMIVLDQLMGLKVALQNPLLHVLFLIVLAITNTGDSFECEIRNYKSAYIFSMVSHVFAFIPFTTTILRFSKDWKCLYFEKTLELLSLVIYLMSIFYVQDVLYFDIGVAACQEQGFSNRVCDTYCDYDDLGTIRSVFALEVFVFYMQVFSVPFW